jgi:hypothetical protein
LNLGRFVHFIFILCSFGESCLLVSCCVGGRCGMACSDADRGKSSRPGAEDQGWSHRLGTCGQAVECSGGAVYGLHHARGDNEHEFLG